MTMWVLNTRRLLQNKKGENMPNPSAKVGSMSAGIDGPATIVVQGATTVMVGGVAMSRVGDALIPHKRHGSKRVHDRVISSGSGTVFAENKPVAFVTSSCSCGDMIATGENTVIVGE